MLASLFRGNSGQRSSQYIESVTDDAHTRSLLFGQSHQVFNLTSSPPVSPFGSPTPRPSTFDDQSGLELEEKDIRVLLAQDARGGDEGPTLLFDSRRHVNESGLPGTSQPAVRAPLPTNWNPPQTSPEKAEDLGRNRSSTFSGSQSSWSRANRDLTNKDEPFLECMFGAPSSAKAASSTKMHIIPGRSRQLNANATERLQRKPTEGLEQRRRAALTRAHTSGQQPTLSSLAEGSRDALLITRLFHVTLDESAKIVNAKGNSSGVIAQDKLPKLVERKVPAFAIGFLIHLPSPGQRPSSSQARTVSSPGYGQSLTSATSSYGSDIQSSWTFLDAIPASLSSSMAISDDGDRRVDLIVENWDVILRALSSFERVATKAVNDQLHIILRQMIEPQNKIPKEKSMQRINQVMVAIHDASLIAGMPSLAAAASDVARRIVYAIRIPRVITGLGFTAGHWIDEARMLYRTCGGKQQNFFLFNLMTAFLGNNVQWLERLAPEWYRKQYQASHRRVQDSKVLASRTIIISDHKGFARRLVYILASFLPGRSGIDGLQNYGEVTVFASSSSPSANVPRRTHQVRAAKPHLQDYHISTELTHEPLSTSASSRGSHTSAFINRSPRKSYTRRDSTRFEINSEGIRTALEGGAGASSTAMPQAIQTPQAYISNFRDNYFPEQAIAEASDSAATADLSKVLSKASSNHRRTSSVSSRWGSLVSGISEIWSNKQGISGDGASGTTSLDASPANVHKRSTSSAMSMRRGNALQNMVDELEQNKQSSNNIDGAHGQNVISPTTRPSRMISATPQLHVDDKDGVIDVELDLPGFLSASSLTPPSHQPAKSRTKTMSFGRDGTDSVSSLRSVLSNVGKNAEDDHVNVGGYLRRHHEDFVLHAVRPYNDLREDIERSMRSEPTPQDLLDQLLQDALSSAWVPICTTVIADAKTFTIHRLTLQRQYEVRSPNSASGLPQNQSTNTSNTLNCANIILRSEEIADEAVMEFDTTLADAIERVLNLGGTDASRSGNASRGHSRQVSTGSNRFVASDVEHLKPAVEPGFPSGLAKATSRDLVIGALEEVIRSVNDDLHPPNHDKIADSRSARVKNEPRQENALREGVKKWMLDIEQTSVW